jgi:hypothetical protein
MTELAVYDAGTIQTSLTAQRDVLRFLAKRVLADYSTRMSGRVYVHVAGATLIAAAFGFSVREVEARRVLIDLGNGETLGAWEAVSEVVDGAGVVRGRGSAICADDEPMWSKRPHFARRAMASTRSAGRALRLLFGHTLPMLGQDVATVTFEEMPNEQD